MIKITDQQAADWFSKQPVYFRNRINLRVNLVSFRHPDRHRIDIIMKMVKAEMRNAIRKTEVSST